MTDHTTFMTLPLELRMRIYEYIALTHSPRRIRLHSDNNLNSSYKMETSAITATCWRIHSEYEDITRKTTTALAFTIVNMDPGPIISYFQNRVDETYLGILQQNKAEIVVNMTIQHPHACKFDMEDFYTWALLLTSINLAATYCADRATWMDIFEANDHDLDALCVTEQDSRQAVRDNIQEIRERAKEFDGDLWRAYPAFRIELQARRRLEWERREQEEASSPVER